MTLAKAAPSTSLDPAATSARVVDNLDRISRAIASRPMTLDEIVVELNLGRTFTGHALHGMRLHHAWRGVIERDASTGRWSLIPNPLLADWFAAPLPPPLPTP